MVLFTFQFIQVRYDFEAEAGLNMICEVSSITALDSTESLIVTVKCCNVFSLKFA